MADERHCYGKRLSGSPPTKSVSTTNRVIALLQGLGIIQFSDAGSVASGTIVLTAAGGMKTLARLFCFLNLFPLSSNKL